MSKFLNFGGGILCLCASVSMGIGIAIGAHLPADNPDRGLADLPLHVKDPVIAPANLPSVDGCTSQPVLSVAWLVKNHPSAWQFDGYQITNGQVKVWTTSGVDNLKVAQGKDLNDDIQMTQFPPHCRDLLWRTAQAFIERDAQRKIVLATQGGGK